MNEYYNFGNKVFIVVKPNFTALSPTIIKMFMDKGFFVVKTRPKMLTKMEAQKLYRTHQKEDFYNALCKYMSSDICVGILLQHKMTEKDAFKVVGELKDKIREKYGESDMRNVLHSSDTLENMEREARIFF